MQPHRSKYPPLTFTFQPLIRQRFPYQSRTAIITSEVDEMNIRIEISPDAAEDEVIIRCRQITGQIQKIQKLIADESAAIPQLTFLKENKEYYFPLKNITFFETNENNVYAHTRNDVYRIRLRLYELEELLPRTFVRISKSTIVNVEQILTINRNLASASLIQFYKSHKQVYVSRRYYKNLSERLTERSYYEN